MSQIKQAFELGIKRLQAAHDTEEKTKVGTLRAGNAGLMTEQGDFIGNCPRITYLRHMGLSIEEAEESKEHMFAAGRGNEDLWLEVLREGWPGKILTESEVPSKWATENGTYVTGRPDVVLCSADGTPQQGIELKLVCSISTAMTVLFKDQPKLEHIIQAVHYGWQHNIPFEIWYTSRVNWHPTEWNKKQMPNSMSEEWDQIAQSGMIEVGYYKNIMSKNNRMYQKAITKEEFLAGSHGTGANQVIAGVKKLLPFALGYELRLTDDTVYFRRAGSKNQWQPSPVSVQRIKNYYEFISKMNETNELPPAPLNLDAHGEPLPWDKALYCSLGDLCCGDKSGNKDLSVWLEKVKVKFNL